LDSPQKRRRSMNIGTIGVGIALAFIAFFVWRGVKNGKIK
jgi:hypothetical protein